MLKEFREFAIKGNVVDMAVGIIVGAAFTTVVKSLVDDLFMPLVGLLLGNVDFTDKFILLREGKSAGPYATLKIAKEAGAVVLSYGQFVNAIVSFLIVSFALFLVVRWVNKLRTPAEAPAPTTRPCPFCTSEIALGATRCPHCTSEVVAAK
ncbi:MAG: large conductance mechanosensitive channel protein MscL [Sorangiineae bacterium]|nr:large conductance mechanosensitive channel protein MscL [Polyangiaceae bacterium]MEB2322054.1 large conductance mechanosensitive channel protein MscL [Sorangiineae bacterium]